jgi:hypothetical protein
MKKILSLCLSVILGLSASAQVTTIPEKIDPNDSVVLIVDLKLMDNSIEHVQNLIDDATAGMGVFIWTWNPYEFPAGHPKRNGTGSQEWKSSNDTLEMTDMGDLVYKYVFKPSIAEWYETDAATVYSRGLSFLVKPKDGGGYGDPDRKSDDINIAVDPPATERDPAWMFPARPELDDIITITYENSREDTTYLQDLQAGDVYLYMECTTTDGTVHRVSNYFQTPSNPDLEMPYVEEGIFRMRFSPRQRFGLPADAQVEAWNFRLRTNGPVDGKEQIPYLQPVDMGCN